MASRTFLQQGAQSSKKTVPISTADSNQEKSELDAASALHHKEDKHSKVGEAGNEQKAQWLPSNCLHFLHSEVHCFCTVQACPSQRNAGASLQPYLPCICF